MLFLRKTDEAIWKSPLSRSTPPISQQFVHDPLFVQISKTRYPPLILGGEETMKQDHTNEIMRIGSKEIKVASFFKLGFTLCKAEQPLRGMKLQEKEAHKG